MFGWFVVPSPVILNANANDSERYTSQERSMCKVEDLDLGGGCCQLRGMYSGVVQERTAHATGGGLMWFTETAESFTWIVWTMESGFIGYSLWKRPGQKSETVRVGCLSRPLQKQERAKSKTTLNVVTKVWLARLNG